MLKYSQIFLVLLSLIFQGRCRNFDDFYEYVNSYLKSTQNYELPKSNENLYKTCDATLYDYGTHDFIIIGGGSAGSILASRLSEISEWNVLLLEAGGDENDFSDIPALSDKLQQSDMNWGYLTKPQTTCCQGMKNNQCIHPRGKVLGGSAVINALMYIRGRPADYDSWGKKFNISGWSYKEVLPYFKKSEVVDFSNFGEGYHGHDGLIHVNHTSPPSITADYLVKAFEEKGLKQVDYNGQHQLGLSRIQFNINFNKRSNGARAYLDPIRKDRSNLNITLKAFVIKILSEDGTAYGVEFVKDGKRYRATSKLEIVLSAGAFNSPQLLLLSGIGPNKELREFGIKVKNDLPSVGKNMEDHPVFMNLYFRTNLTLPNHTLEENLREYLKGKSPFTNGAGCEYIGFFNTNNFGKSEADMEFISVPPSTGIPSNSLTPFNFDDKYNEVFQGYNFLTDFGFVLPLLQPKSKGTVTLKSNSAIDFPIIDINYFSDENREDIETMYQGIKFILSLSETKAFKEINATFISTYPGCEQLKKTPSDRDYWYCAIRHATSTGYHPIGTTKMGSSPESSVVNEDCVVHNMKKLRVVDAGVIPQNIRGHTNAPTYMIAEKISDVIKKYHRKNSILLISFEDTVFN